MPLLQASQLLGRPDGPRGGASALIRSHLSLICSRCARRGAHAQSATSSRLLREPFVAAAQQLEPLATGSSEAGIEVPVAAKSAVAKAPSMNSPLKRLPSLKPGDVSAEDLLRFRQMY